jgi:hypothetical protein
MNKTQFWPGPVDVEEEEEEDAFRRISGFLDARLTLLSASASDEDCEVASAWLRSPHGLAAARCAAVYGFRVA